MVNSLVDVYLHVLQGFRKDVLASYPALTGVDLDFKRIARYCQLRGPTTFLLDLPNLESILKSGLETGRLELKGPLSRAVSKRIRVPRLFAGLWLRVFDKSACLLPDPDVNSIAFLVQLCTFGKKVEVECSTDRRKAALENYHDIERELRVPESSWDADVLVCERGGSDLHLNDRYSPHRLLPLFAWAQCPGSDGEQPTAGTQRLLERCQQVADLVTSALPFFEPVSYSAEVSERGVEGIGHKHGPGAVAERLKGWEKSRFPNWPHKLEHWFPWEQCGRTAGSDEPRPRNHEVASRLIFVPKTAKGPRIIAAESTAHQWCQQLIRCWLVEKIKDSPIGYFLDFSRQDLSGNLVLQASLDRKLATVDLSDASDRLSCWTVERMFRGNQSLLHALHAARTRYLRDEIIPGSKTFIKLRKFASQGTATTFPVQSLCFLIIALASCVDDGEITWDSLLKLRGQVRVYGDDIIVPRRGYERLTHIMTALQLKVNKAKSFKTGCFRESCGTDGYMGYNVTPVKPKVLVADGPASCQAVLDTVNNLFIRSYWHASDYLKSLLPSHLLRRLRVVGVHGAGFSGLTSFSGSHEDHLEQRWNKGLHRQEVRVWSILGQTRKETRDGYSTLLDFFASRSRPDAWNTTQARVASEYVCDRKSKVGLRWEPSGSAAYSLNRLRESVCFDPRPKVGMGSLRTLCLVLRDTPDSYAQSVLAGTVSRQFLTDVVEGPMLPRP